MAQRIKSALKRGLLFLLIPGFLIYFFWSIVSLLDGFWLPLYTLIFGKNPFWGAGFLTTVALALLIGLVLTSRVVQTTFVVNVANKLWSRIPLANFLFGKEFFSKEDLGKTKAVLVEYPSPGWIQIGFLVGKQKVIGGDDLYKVFIPTAPLPATGLFGMTKIVGGVKVTFLKNPPLEVLKLIISCGLTSIVLEKENEQIAPRNASQ